MKLAITVCRPDIKIIVLNLITGKEIRTFRNPKKSPGRFFGMTYDKKRIYVASNNKVFSYNKFFHDQRIEFIRKTGFFHQILLHLNEFWITSTATNGIYCIKDGKPKHLFLNSDLQLVKSKPMQEDINHINSIFIDNNHLLVSCHNRSQPSFILKYHYPDLVFCDKFVLGKHIHNLFVGKNKIWTLDSGGSRAMISTLGDQIQIGDKNNFLRGLCVTDKLFIVGKFAFNVNKEDRKIGDSEIIMVSRKNHQIEHTFVLKNTGEINDMRLLDVYDECHGVQSMFL